MGIIDSISKSLVATARRKIRILFPEPSDDRILKASIEIANKRIAIPVLLGNPITIIADFKRLGLDSQGIEIIDFTNRKDYSEELCKIRQHKPITREQACALLEKPMYYASMLLKNNLVDAIISGSQSPTSETLLPALQIIGTRPGIKTASSYFVMESEQNTYIFSDCAFNIMPDAEQLADIAISTADSARSFCIDPKIAMLSFSTKGSAKHDSVDKVASAVKLAKLRRPDVLIEGELQADAALVPEVAKIKNPSGSILGNANVLIFPDLNSGNIAYKPVNRLANYRAIGPVIQGLNKPVNDLSRGCSVEDIIDLATITVHQALHDSR